MGNILPDGVGTQADFATRLRGLLPDRWFPDVTPVLDGVLAGFASGNAAIFSLLDTVAAQARRLTASGPFLDLIATDFFGFGLLRRSGEQDASYNTRISHELLREKATRAGLASVLTDLTGRAPVIFEPARPADTGGWDVATGWDAAGAWGDTCYPMQVFVVAYRPLPQGESGVAGWDATIGGWDAGSAEWIDDTQFAAPVTDAAIYDAVAATIPAATIAWTRIAS